MLRTVAVRADDDARWAEAQAALERAPSESAEAWMRRSRRFQWLVIVAVLLVSIALAAVLVVVFHGRLGPLQVDVPTWQVVVGFVVAAAGLTLQISGVVAMWRRNRRLDAWHSPLMVLTHKQRKYLLDQVRGRRPVEPARLPLARLLAEQRLSQRTALVSGLGLAVGFVGLWVANPTWWRAGLAIVYALFLAVAGPLALNQMRPVKRFLAEHPADG